MTGGIELLTTSQMSQADRLAAEAGVTSLTLMENSGCAVADAARQRTPPGSGVAIICGPGNNGGDGFVAARHLKRANYHVRLFLLGEQAALKGDAAEMARRDDQPIRPLETGVMQNMDLIIDALFGAGLARPIEGVAADVVAEINASRIPVIAVDVPSGLDGTTGQSNGPVIQATKTITFFRKKPGHLLMPGRALCGDCVVADIAIPSAVLGRLTDPVTAWENSPDLWLSAYPWPKPEAHKYARGHAVVVSGPAEATGAARLAARGALRIGAGLVTLCGTPAATAVNAVHETAVMVHRISSTKDLEAYFADTRRNAVLIGPGSSVGPETAADVLTVLAASVSVVLDADGLTSFCREASRRSEGSLGFLGAASREEASPHALFGATRKRRAPVVMTPHVGEFKRLFGYVSGSKLEQARSAAATSGAIIILKGPDTVIAHPNGRAAINANAPPWLATAGSGDVLAGFVTGLLAQGMPAFEAACAAVWLHGDCACEFGIGLIAEDLPEVLPKVLARLQA